MERLATVLFGGTDLEVSSPVEEDEFGGRVALSAATQSAEGELEPLGSLGASLVSEVHLFISSSNSEAQEETVPPEVDPVVILLAMRLAPTPLHPDSSSGLGVLNVSTEDDVASLEPLSSGSAREPLPLSSGFNLLLRPGGGEVPLGHDDFLRVLEEFRRLPLEDRLKTWENGYLRVSSVWFR